MTVIGSAYVDIRAITDKLEGDIRAALNSIQGQTVSVAVDADTLAARSQIDDMLDDIDGARPEITPDANTAFAEARLALLTRLREVRINMKMDSRPLIMAGNAIARMTGARVLATDIGRMATHFMNIDKAVPGIAKMATLFGSISGAVLSSIGGLSTLTASLGTIITMAAVAAPGMATGFLVGIGTLMVALKDFSKQLPGVTAQYKTLGATIKVNFWDEARESIRDMAQTLFPEFQKGLAGTSRALGRWSAALADALKVHLGNGVVISMFDSLSKSIDIAKGGLEPLVRAFVELGSVGGEYLPRLATWFVDVSTKFGDFIALAADTGDIYRWIDEGIFNLKRLGSVIGETAGFFGGVTEAARLAGSDGLGTVLNFVTRLNEAVNSPEGMKSLSTIFEGANSVATALGDTFFSLLTALGSAAPAIKASFESIAGTIGSISDAITTIISNPEFQAGFAAMFDGIEKGFGALMPVVGEMGPKMGAFLSIIGSLAANIGGVLGAALEVALPLVTALKEAIDPLIPILGDALISIIQELGPTFDIFSKALKDVGPVVADVVKWIADLIVGVVDTLGPALPGITAAVLAFMAVFTAGNAIMGMVKSVQAGIATFQLLRTTMDAAKAAQIAFNISALANPFVLIIAGVAALVAGIIVAYNNVGWFKDFVDQSMGMISDAIGHLVNFWNDSVVPMWNSAMTAAGEFFGAIGKWVADAIKAVQDFFGGFGKGAEDTAGSIGSFFTGIGTAISDAFNGVVEFVSGVFTNIGNVIKTGLDFYISIWTTAFGIIRDVFTNIWNGLVAWFSPIINLIATVIGAVVEIVTAIWTAGWEIISTIFYGIWVNLVRFFTPIIEGIQNTIATVVTSVQTTWNAVWQTIGDFFTTIWNNMVAFYGPILQGIWDFIVAVGAGISLAWNTAWQAIGDFFTTIWNNMVAFYGPILQGIWDFIVAVGAGIAAAWNATWQGISDFFTGIWNGIVAFVSPIVQSISDTIRNVINGVVTWWNTTWYNISRVISDVWNGIVSAVSGFVGDVARNITNFLTDVGRIGQDILNKITNFPTLLINAGTDLINGLVNGVNAGKDAVVNKIKEIASGALDAIKNFFGIKSPSRVMRDQVGKQIGAGLAIGIEASIGAVKKATDKLADAALMNVPDIELPSIKGGSAALASGAAGSTAVLSRNTVLGASGGSASGTGVFGQPAGGTTNVTFQVNPSAGLNEEQIGVSALEHLYWKLSNQP